MNGTTKIYDYLVIGSGIAGLTYALQVSRWGKVAVITKKSLYDCNTDYAQGGIAAVLDPQIPLKNILKTLIKQERTRKKKVIQQIIMEGPKLIQYLIDLGTDFTRKDETYDNCLENLSLTMEEVTLFVVLLMQKIPLAIK